MFSVAIVYRPEGGRLLSLATVADPDLLSQAAAIALTEAYRKARSMADRDPDLSAIQFAEADKLKQVLRHFLPDPEPAAAAVM